LAESPKANVRRDKMLSRLHVDVPRHVEVSSSHIQSLRRRSRDLGKQVPKGSSLVAHRI